MEKKLITAIILVLFSALIFQSCTSTSKPGKIFLGEWKRVDQPDSTNLTIKREEGALIVSLGKDKLLALYKPGQNIIRSYFMSDTVIIKYIDKNDHIVMNRDGGEFRRVN
jgi:hypothetical protein